MGLFDKDPLKKILHSGVEARADADLPLADDASEGQQDVGPCGMVSVKGCHALDVERGGKEPVVSFQYVYISIFSEYTPTKFWVLFVGLTSWKVTVEGTNLRPIFDRINDHCLRRIRKVNRDFDIGDNKPFVSSIEVDDVTPVDKS